MASLICYQSSINGAELKVGQENLYNDPCQDWLDLINKKLTSPNYPEKYDPNTICKWDLITEKENYISLDFEVIDVSDKNKCFHMHEWFLISFFATAFSILFS